MSPTEAAPHNARRGVVFVAVLLDPVADERGFRLNRPSTRLPRRLPRVVPILSFGDARRELDALRVNRRGVPVPIGVANI